MSSPNDEGNLPAPRQESALEQLERERTTARASLTRERQEALDRQARLAGWLMLFGAGPATIAAVIAAMTLDRGDLLWPLIAGGLGLQIWYIWKEQRRIRRIERELEDPIDGS